MYHVLVVVFIAASISASEINSGLLKQRVDYGCDLIYVYTEMSGLTECGSPGWAIEAVDCTCCYGVIGCNTEFQSCGTANGVPVCYNNAVASINYVPAASTQPNNIVPTSTIQFPTPFTAEASTTKSSTAETSTTEVLSSTHSKFSTLTSTSTLQEPGSASRTSAAGPSSATASVAHILKNAAASTDVARWNTFSKAVGVVFIYSYIIIF